MDRSPAQLLGIRRALLQRESSAEIRAVLAAAIVADLPNERAGLNDLPAHAASLASGACLPVGSVEFVHRAMEVAGMVPPAADPYPQALRPFMGRSLSQATAGEVLASSDRVFVKPVALKLFDGFVYDPAGRRTEHIGVQLRALRELNPDTPVWTSPVVSFQAEWRFYLAGGEVLGRARYDADGLDNAPPPSEDACCAAITAYGRATPYAPDLGVTGDGETVLVEVNEPYAIGLYFGAMTATQYLHWLAAGWQSIRGAGEEAWSPSPPTSSRHHEPASY